MGSEREGWTMNSCSGEERDGASVKFSSPEGGEGSELAAQPA
jgi:hypothetical protein